MGVSIGVGLAVGVGDGFADIFNEMNADSPNPTELNAASEKVYSTSGVNPDRE